MDAHPTPDELNAENELICEKLLGWRSMKVDHDARLWCVPPTRGFTRPTPSFNTWADAGLILDALTARRDHGWCLGDAEPARDVRCFSMGIHGYKYNAIRQTGPEAIRAAAIYFIRSLP